MDDRDTGVAGASHDHAADVHRRRASHLYGLIVSGAVLATASDELRLGRISVLLVVTLLVYWAAESYVHWIALRARVQRDLTPGERRMILRDGWPLVAASGVPLLFLGLEALVGMETSVALDLTLAVNTVLLFIIGWQMGEEGRLEGSRRVLSAVVTGCLGMVLIALKALLH
jgi:hypothetical protein